MNSRGPASPETAFPVGWRAERDAFLDDLRLHTPNSDVNAAVDCLVLCFFVDTAL